MKSEKGQTLFEVVVAIGMMAAILVGIVSLAALAVRNSTFTKNKTSAARYVQEVTEWLRGKRDDDFTVFLGRASAQGRTYCIPVIDQTIWPAEGPCGPTNYISGTTLLREFTLAGETSTITATVRVYWSDGDIEHEVRSVTYFTDWRER